MMGCPYRAAMDLRTMADHAIVSVSPERAAAELVDDAPGAPLPASYPRDLRRANDLVAILADPEGYVGAHALGRVGPSATEAAAICERMARALRAMAAHDASPSIPNPTGGDASVKIVGVR